MNWPELLPDERVLRDESVALFRQIHPSWVADGQISSQAFSPMPKDNGMLSVRQSTIVSAREAYQFHTALGFESIGTYQVTVGDGEAVGLRAVDDSRLAPAPLGHAYIDFRGIGRRPADRTAKQLRTYAMRHGMQFDPLSMSP